MKLHLTHTGNDGGEDGGGRWEEQVRLGFSSFRGASSRSRGPDLNFSYPYLAAAVPGATVDLVWKCYPDLLPDVAGGVPIPAFPDFPSHAKPYSSDGNSANQISFKSKPPKNNDIGRKKGTPWTEEEHRLKRLVEVGVSVATTDLSTRIASA